MKVNLGDRSVIGRYLNFDLPLCLNEPEMYCVSGCVRGFVKEW